MKQFLMGNEAIAMGAIHAGVNVVSGYPGTPSTEILETVAKYNDGSIYVEWSTNEKAALEVGAGASYAGARALVTMKQVGLNVASDPLMSFAYVGARGGMVIVAADDPGPISSQTEQDTRTFAAFAKIPVFDPSSPDEAYEMIKDAFEYSEKYQTPVLFRPTTRICHGCASIETADSYERHMPDGFSKDTMRYVIFPRTSYQNHLKIEARNPKIGEDFSSYRFNRSFGGGKLGIVSSGVSYEYLQEALIGCPSEVKQLKITTAFPFPDALALSFLDSLDEVLVVEELDPVLERALIFLCGQRHLTVKIHGKLDKSVQAAGENTVESIKTAVYSFVGLNLPQAQQPLQAPPLPIRPPVLCAGCPHRASFYAVKTAMKGKKAVFSGDIGCYTLGNAQPLDMVDTCLCMGGGITIAQGLHRVDKDETNFAFVGDSTFFASGITGVVNAVYNQTDIVLIVLDNSTTAMTGHQPHPGTGITMMGEKHDPIDIAKVLQAIGVSFIETVNPLEHAKAVDAVRRAAAEKGVRAIIFKAPCISVSKPTAPYEIDEKCVKCQKCIKELGCPALVFEDGGVRIEKSLCFGCGLCAQLCPTNSIRRSKDEQ